jgi:hypothetical protein
MGGVGRVGQRAQHRQPEPADPGREVVAQRRLAAEQMRATADVEQQPVGRIERDHRGIAVAAVGDPFEETGVGRGIMPSASAARSTAARHIAPLRFSTSAKGASGGQPFRRRAARASRSAGRKGKNSAR